MRFVPVKSVDQQAVLCLHRVRQGFIEERTATINRLRGLLSEFGVVLPLKADTCASARMPRWRICRAGPNTPSAICSLI